MQGTHFYIRNVVLAGEVNYVVVRKAFQTVSRGTCTVRGTMVNFGLKRGERGDEDPSVVTRALDFGILQLLKWIFP